MKAVILAAGEGSRMRPLTENRAKSMLPIANKPVLEHIVYELAAAGIHDIVIVVGYAGEQIRNWFGSGERHGVSFAYLEERKQMGTAHAAGLARKLVDGPFLVMNGDVIIGSEDIRQLAASGNAAMAVYEVEDARRYGCVETEGDRVVAIHEKSPVPPSRLANAGLYLLPADAFDIIDSLPLSPRGEYEITDCLKVLTQRPGGLGFHRLSSWLDIGYPWDLLRANEALLSGLVGKNFGEVEQGAVIKGAVHVGKGTVIRSGSCIQGPVIIGENCDIGPNCYIRPATAIGDGCHVGAFVEIKNSIIMRGTKVPHQNYAGDSIIGENCNLGAGTRVANLRFDGRTVRADSIDTGRRKFGAVLGDGVQTGVNVSINPGTVIGGGTRIGPGAVVTGVVKPGTIIQ